MQVSFYNFFERILLIIGYEKDPIVFAHDFLKLCKTHAVLALLQAQNVSEEKQKQIFEEAAKNPDRAGELAKRYIDPEAFRSALDTAVKHQFAKYLQGLDPHLTDEERTQLKEYIASVPFPDIP